MSIQVTEDKRNEAVLANAGGVSGNSTSSGIGESIKNLSTIANLAKSKKLKLTMPKKLDISNAKANFRTDFLTPEAKKAFIYLRKAFTKAPSLKHFDPEYHIWIEIDVLRYAISGVLSQLTLNQLSSNHMTHENYFSESKIGQ